MRRSALFALMLAACSPQAPAAPLANPPLPSAFGDKLLEDVRILSADDMEGRLAGSPGGERARAYVIGRFNEIGLAPAVGASFERPFQFQRGSQAVTGVNLLGLIPGTAGSKVVTS